MKSFGQFCGVAKALDVVGERWTLLIVRDLLLGPRRYRDLQTSLAGISPSVLSGRLTKLEELEFIAHSGHRRYELTPLGKELEPVVLALGAFGARYLTRPEKGDRLDPRWAMLSLKRRFRRASGRGKVALEVDQGQYGIESAETRIDVYDGAPRRPDVRIEAALPAWFGLLCLKENVDGAKASGLLSISGSQRVATSFFRAIGVPLR